MNFFNEIIINKTFTHHDKDIKILAINDKSLWYAYQIDLEIYENNNDLMMARSFFMNEIYFGQTVEILGLCIYSHMYCNGHTSNYHPKSDGFKEIFDHFSDCLDDNYTKDNTIIRQIEFKETINCESYDKHGLQGLLAHFELLIDSRKIYKRIEKKLTLDFENETTIILPHPIQNHEFTCYLKPLKNLHQPVIDDLDSKLYQSFIRSNKDSGIKDIIIILPFECNETVFLEAYSSDFLDEDKKSVSIPGYHIDVDSLSSHGMKVTAQVIGYSDEEDSEPVQVELLAVSSYSDKKFYSLEAF